MTRRKFRIGFFAVALAVALAGGVAFAVHELGLFELDGNATQETLVDDWSTLYGGDGHSLYFSGIIADGANMSIYTTGGSKDDLDVSQWRWTDGSVPDKDDLLDAFAALYKNPADSHVILYFGADRYANNGDSQIGFWFFKNTVGLNADGTFSGVHQVGDLLILSDFTQGGAVPTVKVYAWVGSGGSDGPLDLRLTGLDCANSAPDDAVCGEVNSSDATSPWAYTPKSGTSGTFPHGSFFEAGLDLTVLMPQISCLSSFIAETRSSQSVTAELKDFVLGGFDTCKINVEKSGPSLTKVGDTAHYTYTITSEAIAPLYLDTITDDPVGNLKTQAVAANCGTLDPNAHCTFSTDFTVPASAPDPLVNTVTVHYNDRQDYSGTAVSGTADHSANLFQPSVGIEKTGPADAQVGDNVTYHFTITNTSSTDSPSLVFDSVTDDWLGSLAAEAGAAGCGTLAPGGSCTFTKSRTVLAGDPDPTVNHVTTHYHPTGYTNDIYNTASHSLNLFQPGIRVAKTGPALSKVGDNVTYTFTITNTSSADTPNLVLTSVVDTLLGTLTADATTAGCGTLASGAACTFTKSRVVLATDPDPLPNTVTVHYHPLGSTTDFSDNASHSVNLFQPSLQVLKTGTELSKIGDTVTYTFTVNNTSSSDTPNLVLNSISDTLLGDLAADANAHACTPLAPGGSCTFTKTRVVLATDPDPLPNTVTAHYHPTGFTNDISAGASHSVNLFQPTLQIVKGGPTLSKVGDSVTYTFTITNTSSSDTPNLILDGVTDTLLGNLAGDMPANCTPLAPSASCSFTKARVVQAGDPDPLPNTVTAHYHPNGFPNDISAQSAHSVNLFQPGVTIAKTGPAISKVGDTVTYTFTINNTSSTDTPNLVLNTISDSLLGDLAADANANGCTPLAPGASCAFSKTRTVLAADPDPLPNTVTVHYHPDGFANDITHQASHSVNLFQPSVQVVKTAPALSKVGDSVTYTFTVNNTSSADTPNLVLNSISDTLLGDLAADANAHSCTPLAPGGSCTFTKSRTVQVGDPDPLPNTVTVHYRPDGFANDITHSASHSVNLFQAGVQIVKGGPTLSKVGDTVNYTFTITNTGSTDTPNLVFDSISDPLLPNLATLVPAACSTLAPGASCSFGASRVVLAGDPDPVNNTVTVHYHPTGFTNDISSSSSHSVNLFQPAVTVAKTGTSLTKVGDTASYTFTITNSGSADSPSLILNSVSDSVLGDLTADANANGCGSLAPSVSCTFSKTRVIQAGDPNPLNNTVTVHYHPSGFANDISNSASHTTNIFGADFSIAKTGTVLSKVGEPVLYGYTITNNGTTNAPALNLVSITDDRLGNLAAAATAAGCGSLASGASCNFTAGGTVPVGAADPFVNTVSATYQVAGFPNQYTKTASWSVNLFQPSVTVAKTGDPYSKIGDTAHYHFVITNTSSADTPNLVLASVVDTVLGDITALAASACGSLAPTTGCSFDATHVVLATDADPLVNTVAVLFHPAGFPNNVTAGSSWSTDIVHPSYIVAKTCLTDPVNAGASANFRINLENTGDIPLNVHVIDALLGIDTTVTLGVKPSTTPCLSITNDPGNGCWMVEAGIVATGTEVLNDVNATATLPASYNLPNSIGQSASAFCTVQTGGSTRTPGFWQTHFDYTSHVFTVHLGSNINLGWKDITSLDDLFGMFWASNSKDSLNKKRSALCQARMIASFQALAAILNSGLSNGKPLPVTLLEIQTTLAGTDIAAIQALGTLLGDYNTSGDTVAIVDADGYVIVHANPKAARDIADLAFADCK